MSHSVDGACLLLVPVKTGADSQLLQTRRVVVQPAMNRSKRMFVVLTLWKYCQRNVVQFSSQRSFCFGMFCLVASHPHLDKGLQFYINNMLYTVS